MIEWVFFDVGSVLYNDLRQGFWFYQRSHELIQQQHPAYTLEEMFAEREELVLQGRNWISEIIVTRMLGANAWGPHIKKLREELLRNFDDNHLLNHNVLEVLTALSDKYRLGVIANQPAECRASLKRRGLLRFFEVVGISEELDLYKPDVELYRWAVKQAECDPAKAVMIGDRLDNDVAPAQELNMKTIHLNAPIAESIWQASTPEEELFMQSAARVPQFSPASAPGIEPDQTVSQFAQIPTAIESIVADG